MLLTAAAALLLAAAPVATWWLVGDLSEDIVDPDYLIRPIEIPGSVQLFLGLSSTLLAAGAAAVLARALWRREVDRKWLPPVVLLMFAGMVVGAGWRVLTAGAGGANIGDGIVILFGGPLVVALVIAAVVSGMMKPVQRPDPPTP